MADSGVAAVGTEQVTIGLVRIGGIISNQAELGI